MRARTLSPRPLAAYTRDLPSRWGLPMLPTAASMRILSLPAKELSCSLLAKSLLHSLRSPRKETLLFAETKTALWLLLLVPIISAAVAGVPCAGGHARRQCRLAVPAPRSLQSHRAARDPRGIGSSRLQLQTTESSPPGMATGHPTANLAPSTAKPWCSCAPGREEETQGHGQSREHKKQ